MRATRLLRSALLLLALAGAGAAPAQPDARAVLAKVSRAYTASPSVSLTFVQQYAPAGFPDTTPETGRLVLQAPDRLRFEYDGAEGKLFTFDGTAGRQYVAADRQMVVRTLTPEERQRLPLLFLEAPDRVLDRFAATAADAANGLSELTLVPKGGDEPRKVTLTATAEGEVKRLVILDREGNRTTFTFTKKESGPRRPASDFTLVPPKGTKVVGG
ncbi:outer membrane lipoprotein carrier protein LolA [Acidobacteria bacterium ACD]|nr:MAG: outer membrane lipoprotein carrier protein LolA [Acidobacteriota bacterium]MCE7960097.1 outer membrane lipoprotein carrier protein LolA [Acidobacteria bacterium ACB2]MDL1951055.1 outer membrane lipoprotein carrier protein LolA [Acidobacteria bacterium ACD]